jgi:hypothetical protein
MNRLDAIETRLSVLTWIATTNIALSITILWKVFH